MCINPSKFDGLFRRSGSGSSTATTTTPSTNNGQKNENHDDGIYHTNKSSSTSALRRMTPFILFGYLFNTLAYFAIVYAPFSERITFAPYPQFCPEDSSNINNTHTSCTRRDLFAFQAVSFLNLTYLGLLGTYTFFFSECRAVSWNEKSGASTSSELLPPTPHGRYFGKLSAADSINAVIVIFQGWDFMASLFFEEHCTLVMMMHHLLAFVCGFFSLVYEVSERKYDCCYSALGVLVIIMFWNSLIMINWRMYVIGSPLLCWYGRNDVLQSCEFASLFSFILCIKYYQYSVLWRSQWIQQYLPLFSTDLWILPSIISRVAGFTTVVDTSYNRNMLSGNVRYYIFCIPNCWMGNNVAQIHTGWIIHYQKQIMYET